MDIIFDPNIPIYMQVIDKIKKDIITGVLKGGDKLPSVRELSQDLKVNPNTVQRSYQELEREEITFSKRGMGTFVKEDENLIKQMKYDMASQVLNDFIRNMSELGFSKEEILNTVSSKINEGEK